MAVELWRSRRLVVQACGVLCYVDESDQGDCFAFAGVLFTPSGVKQITADLNEVVRGATWSYGVDPSAEIHGHPMFHGKDEWSSVPPRARVDLFVKVVDATLAHAERVLLRSVSRDRLRRRQLSQSYPEVFSAERVCLTYLLQRVHMIARSRGDYALVIADERHDRDLHRDLFAEFQKSGTPGDYMRSDLGHLIDTIHFAPSDHSRALQAADVLAFLYRRRRTTREPDPRAQKAMNDLWAKIDSSGLVFDEGMWP